MCLINQPKRSFVPALFRTLMKLELRAFEQAGLRSYVAADLFRSAVFQVGNRVQNPERIQHATTLNCRSHCIGVRQEVSCFPHFLCPASMGRGRGPLSCAALPSAQWSVYLVIWVAACHSTHRCHITCFKKKAATVNEPESPSVSFSLN